MGNDKQNYYKIGISRRPKGRVKDLNVPFDLYLIHVVYMSEPLKTAIAIEKLVHEHFWKNRVRGERFRSIEKEGFVEIVKVIIKTYKLPKSQILLDTELEE